MVFSFFVLAGIFAYLFATFNPNLIFLETIPAGGDTPSHYMAFKYMKEYLLPNGKIMGYFMGNYAGFPIFYHYFPLPFFLASMLSEFLPPQVAFKLTTILGSLFLPIATYLLFSLLGFERSICLFSSILSLYFLFNEENTMWGGNIPSTLAGEFAFSFSFSVFVALLGFIFYGIEKERHLILNSVLFAIMGLSHGYTLFTFLLISTFFLLKRTPIKELLYLFKFYLLGVGFMAYWFIPFLYNLPYTTPFMFKWHFGSIREVLPPHMVPFFALSFAAFFYFFKEKSVRFLLYSFSVSVFLYFIAYPIGLGDIRFLTFAQYFLLLPSVLWTKRLGIAKMKYVILFFLFTAVFLRFNTTYIPKWIEWNYSGIESKPAYPELVRIFEKLKELHDGGRVVYEHSLSYDKYGTVRIFELMKMFTGRDTLEGLYMQSSITSPYVFYIQSEISKEISAPFWQYPVANLDLKTASMHLSMFGVTHYIVKSDKVKEEIRKFPDYYEPLAKIGDIEIYKVKTTDYILVKPVTMEPVVYRGKNWKKDFYEWFKDPQNLDVPLILAEKDDVRFRLETEDIKNIPRRPLCFPLSRFTIRVTQRPEEIQFETPLIGHPHLVRVSYHPLFRVEGAKKVYLCAPSFMLVIPESGFVSIKFDRSWIHTMGDLYFFLSLGFLVILVLKKRTSRLNGHPSTRI
ncbi:MAG: 6-pyruvoyl-tetrahydropterin synthase-related protein [Desulfobacterota bacterium]|nr:6-pyruvoyl-tetrahydropterin synthase-related protein [Thermodesulfobacteriota bacterium]MDW8001589.1 6-pyruvoyl-tetrahydropterin synthase-related protein [Deltaproteobacteria bacterium]